MIHLKLFFYKVKNNKGNKSKKKYKIKQNKTKKNIKY